MEEQSQEWAQANENSVEKIVRVMVEVDQLLLKHSMQICVSNGIYFDDDPEGNIRVRLSIVQKNQKAEKD
jgi:hypothetical protein